MTLSDYLTAENLKPAQFAKVSGVSPSIIGRLLNGSRGVSLEVALRISEATGGNVRLNELIRKRPDLAPTPSEGQAA